MTTKLHIKSDGESLVMAITLVRLIVNAVIRRTKNLSQPQAVAQTPTAIIYGVRPTTQASTIVNGRSKPVLMSEKNITPTQKFFLRNHVTGQNSKGSVLNHLILIPAVTPCTFGELLPAG